MGKIKPKAAKLEKPNMPTDNRKANKVKRSQRRDYLEYFHAHGHECLECGTRANIEAHHVVPQDNRTVVPFCSYCHRLHNKNGALIVEYDDGNGNTPFSVLKGYCMHHGTKSAEFRAKWNDKKLLEIANKLYKEYEINA